MRVNVIILPEKKDNPKDKGFIIKSFINIAKELTETFKIFIKKDVEVRVYHSLGAMRSDMLASESYETHFGDYNDEFKKIYIAHPILLEPIYKENAIRHYNIVIKYILIKFFLNEMFQNETFRNTLYRKNLINKLASFLSKNYSIELKNKELVEFEIEKKYNNRELLDLFIYSLLVLNGEDYIIEKVKDFFEYNNLEELSKGLFDKEPKNIIELAKEKMIVNKKKIDKLKRRI